MALPGEDKTFGVLCNGTIQGFMEILNFQTPMLWSFPRPSSTGRQARMWPPPASPSLAHLPRTAVALACGLLWGAVPYPPTRVPKHHRPQPFLPLPWGGAEPHGQFTILVYPADPWGSSSNPHPFRSPGKTGDTLPPPDFFQLISLIRRHSSLQNNNLTRDQTTRTTEST